MSAGFDYLVSTCGRISGIVYVVTPVFLKMLQSPVIEAWSKQCAFSLRCKSLSASAHIIIYTLNAVPAPK